MNAKETAERIFMEGVKGVLPGKLINDLISLRGSLLKIGYLSYDLEKTGNIYIIGAGKASSAMAHYVESIAGIRIREGHIVTKYGYACKLRFLKVTEAGHPIPDLNSYSATNEVLQIADKAGENDLVICLWSGGGSSLLADYPEFSSPEEMGHLNSMLVRCGADISEINAVRKHLSKVKGGQLARHIWPASAISIIISDVIGDPPDIIASGPTVPDNSTFADALAVIGRYQLANEMPSGLLNYINDGVQGIRPETPKPGDEIFRRTVTFFAGNNRSALQAANVEAEKLDLTSFIITDSLSGETGNACSSIIDTINNYKNNSNLQKPICLLFGGETTVKVTGLGQGGRNQHLALTAAFRLQHIPGITLLAAGSDGNDGDTDAAGAVVDSGTIHEAVSTNVDPELYLNNFDSYNFFKKAGGHIRTGPTLTNVMDLIVVIIE
jgi:hydroxypyruvate reductase/glycerate 2-kinase